MSRSRAPDKSESIVPGGNYFYIFGRNIFLMQRVLPCKQKDIVMAAPRPPDVSLDSSKAFALGFKPLSLIEELKALRGVI